MIPFNFTNLRTTHDSDDFPAPGELVVPLGEHCGAFAATRKYDVHTGVDLYAHDGTVVRALQDGVVRSVMNFTGPAAGLDWWLDTKAVLVEDRLDLKGWLYGEIIPIVSPGQHLYRGDVIGHVAQVLKKNKGRPTSMLHLERYDMSGFFEVAPTRRVGGPMPAGLLNPTEEILTLAQGCY